jgi:hypothetical protein
VSIRRVNRGKGHSYVDSDTGEKIPGVTTILDGGIPKPALINWAANATIEYAVDNWDALTDKAVSVRTKELSGARYAAKDIAANRGTQVHGLAERLVEGDRVAIPEGLEGHVQSYVRFLDEFDVQPVLVERTVYSRTHKYCGTFDLIADLLDPDDPEPDPDLRHRMRWLLDIKTNRSGIFGETALQLAAYRYADVWIDEKNDGVEMEMPEVERTGAIHVRADGYDLIPVEAGPAQFRQFLYAQQIARFTADSRELVGQPVISPDTSTYRLAREDS